jgi:hypothetical protein
MNRFSLRALVVLASGSALAATSLQVAEITAAHASPSSVTAWQSYPNNDSIEQGDGALDLVTSLNSSSGKVTSSSAPLASSTASTAVTTNLTVLLRNSDGSTGALPPNTTSQPLLSSVRVGLTPTTTVLEGSHGGLTLDLSETKPYEPSTSIGQTAAQISNGPFMYFVLDVTNTSGSTTSPSAVYLGMDGACGSVLNNFPTSGSVGLPLCSSSDTGGTRYLVANTGAGVAAAVGSSLTSGFASSGTVSGSGSSGSAALSLQVPALGAGASWESTLVYGAWNTAAGVKPVSGSIMPFYYRQWWSSASSMLTFAQENAAAAIAASASFDAGIANVASDSASRYAASHAFRGWRHEQWLVAQGSTPHYYVVEGSFGYLSTLDVAYEYEPLQTQYEPWKSKLELDELGAAYETDSAGNKFLEHDVGQWNQLTAGAAYDKKSGTRKHMPVEHNLDFVAMAMLWEQATGSSYNHTLLQQLIGGVESHDTNSDGRFDVASMTACLPDGTCRTEPTGTTYDGGVSAAASSEEGNTILALKAGVVESIAAGDGLSAPGGGSLTTVAQRHFTAVQPFIKQQSSDTSLAGATSKPGYLSDALLYAGALGSSATIESNLSWVASAIASNDTSVLGSCTTCVAPMSTSDSTTWISKALDGDVVSRWLAATHSGLAHSALDLPKVSKIWVSRSTAYTSGTYEAIAYKGETYLRGDYYPRAASIWAVTYGTGGGPPPPPTTGTISGSITNTSSAAISGATVQACPTAGVACGVSVVTGSNGAYTLTVPTGAVFVWAQASGFTDTYLGGGHSSSDSADTTTNVTSGSSTTVNLSMPTATPPPAGSVFINVGSTAAYTDSQGNKWVADKDFTGGTAYTAKSGTTVTGTPDPTLYLTQRYGAFSYSIPEAAGSYQVTLKFAEVAKTGVGTRVFSVQAEGANVLTNLDVFAEVGEDVADDKTFTVPVSDGALSLNFVANVQNPMVEGIEVVPAGGGSPPPPPPPTNGTVSGTVTSTSGPAISGATVNVCPSAGVACGVTTTSASNGSFSVSVPAGSYYVWSQASGFTDTYSGGGHSASDPADSPVTVSSGATTSVSLSMPPVVTSFTPIFINAGSTKAYTDTAGHVWLADRDFSGGKTFTAATTTISGTPDSTLYLTQRYGVFTYSIPVPNGSYSVTLKLAETWATGAGQRVFSIQAEGATVLSNLDIFSEVGANTVDDKTFTVTVSSGVLTLTSVANVQNPMVEGIEIQGA